MEAIDADYPAAHSMDTVWFATDRDGHVAVFDTGKSGHAPADVAEHESSDAPYDLLDWHTPPGPRPNPARFIAINVAAELARMGVFFFSYDPHPGEAAGSPGTFPATPFYSRHGLSQWDLAGPYVRVVLPAAFLHVDQLPPELRNRVKRYRLSDVSFVEREFVQPAEHLACTGYGTVPHPVYLCGDGKTLRPWPGKKNYFGRFFREFLAADPSRAEWFVFDWLSCDSHDPPGKMSREEGDR